MLPMNFPTSLWKICVKAVKEEDPEGFIVGEVWEDASNKESYGARRKFLLGEELDSVMNYVSEMQSLISAVVQTQNML